MSLRSLWNKMFGRSPVVPKSPPIKVADAWPAVRSDNLADIPAFLREPRFSRLPVVPPRPRAHVIHPARRGGYHTGEIDGVDDMVGAAVGVIAATSYVEPEPEAVEPVRYHYDPVTAIVTDTHAGRTEPAVEYQSYSPPEPARHESVHHEPAAHHHVDTTPSYSSDSGSSSSDGGSSSSSSC